MRKIYPERVLLQTKSLFEWLNLQAYAVCFQNLMDLSVPQVTNTGSTGEWSSHLGAPVLPDGNLATFSAVSASQTTT